MAFQVVLRRDNVGAAIVAVGIDESLMDARLRIFLKAFLT